MEENDLLELLKKGCKKAFESLFELYYKSVLTYILSLCRDFALAEDIVQHCFMVLWSKRAELNIHTSVKKYLFSTAHNFYMDICRKKQREAVSFELWEYTAQYEILPEEESLENLEKDLDSVKKIIDKLPPRCKEILIMNKLQGLKYREIAEKLEISIKTVEAQMSIAMKKLRNEFHEKTTVENFELFI